jgi:hypothetical protein
MQPSPIARALESLVGPWLSPLAAILRLSAVLALAAAVAFSILRGLRLAAAWRYGWERRIVVRCPRCGRPAAEPERPVCPEGHDVRFPPRTILSLYFESGSPGWIVARHVYAIAVVIGTACLAAWGFVELRLWHLQTSLGEIFAASSYLFFAAALFCASWAAAPGSRGAIGRTLHFALAALLLPPAGVSFLLAELVEPPPRILLGSVWATPTATYIAPTRGRGRRVGPSAVGLEASLVEARIPALGIVWQGLETLRLDGREIPWKGAGGFLARRLASWAGPLSEHGVWLSRSQRALAFPRNVKVWIVNDRRRIVFLTEDQLQIPEVPPASAGRGPPV